MRRFLSDQGGAAMVETRVEAPVGPFRTPVDREESLQEQQRDDAQGPSCT